MSQFKRGNETPNKKKKKVVFFSQFCLQNHHQKQHASHKKTEAWSVKLPVLQLATRLQYNTGKNYSLCIEIYPPKISVAQKEEKEGDLQRDLWQTPEEEAAVNEINDKLQTINCRQKHWSLEHWHLICKFSLLRRFASLWCIRTSSN